ncbi:hypothetical protein HPB47_021781, partial [Ixodes persulcatus]
FPRRRPVTLQLWVENAGRCKWEPSKTNVVCSDHFEEKLFGSTGKIVLQRRGAIPTTFNLPTDLVMVILYPYF